MSITFLHTNICMQYLNMHEPHTNTSQVINKEQKKIYIICIYSNVNSYKEDVNYKVTYKHTAAIR